MFASNLVAIGIISIVELGLFGMIFYRAGFNWNTFKKASQPNCCSSQNNHPKIFYASVMLADQYTLNLMVDYVSFCWRT